MSSHTGASCLTNIRRLTLLALLCFPATAHAVADIVQSLDPWLVNALLILVAAVVLALLVVSVRFKRQLTHTQGALSSSQQLTQQTQEHLHRSVNGIVHLDAHNTIIYANRMAAHFFGKKVEQLVGTPIDKVCPVSIQAPLADALALSDETSLQCPMGYHQRETRVRVAAQAKAVGDCARVLYIDDIDGYQRAIDWQTSVSAHYQDVLDYAEMHQAKVDFETSVFHCNSTLSALLNCRADEPVPLDTLTSQLVNTSGNSWSQCLQWAGEGKPQTFEGRLQQGELDIPVQVRLVPHCPDEHAPASAMLLLHDLSHVERLKQKAGLLQQQLKASLNACPLPAYMLNAEKQIVDCNRAFGAFFQVDNSRLLNKKINEVEHFDDAFKALHANVQGVGVKTQTAAVQVSPDASADIQHFLLSYKTASDHAGSIGFIQDMTPLNALRKEAESQVAAMQHLIASAPVGIALCDENDQLLTTNPVFDDVLGYPPQELHQQTFYKLFKQPEQSAKVSRLLHQQGQVNHFDAELLCKDQQVCQTRLDVTALNSGDSRYVFWVADARELHFQIHKLERLIAYSKMPVAVIGEDGFERLNPAACAFFDIRNQQQLQGTSLASPALNGSDEDAQAMAERLARLRTEKQVQEFEWTHQHNGQSLPCEITLVPLFDGHTLVATLCMWVDLRAIEQANAARLEAVNLREAAEREIAEKQQLLENSQDLLASRARSLQSTQEKLAAAETDLAAKLHTIQDLQQAHEDISDHLHALQQDYDRNRELLNESQQANAELETQLEQSTIKVQQLQTQRNQIADALQYSEKNYKEAQAQLAASEQNRQRLKEEQQKQQASLQQSMAHIDALKQSIHAKDQQIQDVSGQISSLQSQLNSSNQASETLREQLLNQRKASELAEHKRRELELACQSAQAELSNKSGHLEHLQHEMQMLEQMSRQQKGDMQKQTEALASELQAKQQQLEQTEQALNQARQLSEEERQQRAAREEELARLQQELQDVEQRSAAQQQKIAEADASWQAQQQALQQELNEKQQELQATRDQLNSAQQQTEEDKTRQQALLKQLEAELQDVESRAAAQAQQVAQSDQEWQEKQQLMAQELAEKKAQLDATQQQLNHQQQQAEAEKLAHQAQQEKLQLLKQELSDVESRASKQREMMSGNDEQWRQHHAEIERQKQQLQQALQEAEAQNQAMQSALENNLQALKQAESTVSRNQSDEQQLQQALDAARQDTENLKHRLTQQEAQEQQLKQQVEQQQQSLQQREDSIQALEQEQQRLTEALRAVKEEYAQSRASLDEQNASQQQLTEQLKALEDALHDSKQQLSHKEHELQDAQRQIASSADKLAAQEHALITAQKQELQQEQSEQKTQPQQPLPEYATLPMPDEPEVWFDLLPYLQDKRGVTSLATTLQELIDRLHQGIDALDASLAEDNEKSIQIATRKLIGVLDTLQSSPLHDMARKFQMCCENQLIDHIAISWPASRANLMSTLRVIYSHLHASTS